MSKILTIGSLVLFLCSYLAAQDNYEIQVYGSDIVPAESTMVELHSNYTARGSETMVGEFLPTKSAFHETIEITHGFSSLFETGFYIFTSARSGNGWQYVGSHIRPRIKIPEEWNWPVGVSLSGEFGYQRRQFSADDWTAELRPIIDKRLGTVYLALNLPLEYSFHGDNGGKAPGFSPDAKISCDLNEEIALGIEYYGAFGPIGNFDPLSDQEHQIFPSVDLNVAPDIELNAGVGFGLTESTDRLIFKCIVGKRF